MATIATQSFSRLVGVRKNKTGEAVDLRRALADPSVGEQVLENFRFISAQLDVLRTLAHCVREGGSLLLAGASGAGKSSILYTFANLLTLPYPGEKYNKISAAAGGAPLARCWEELRSDGRSWLVVVPDFSSGDFAYAMRGALNGALLSSKATCEFVPENSDLIQEYVETITYLHLQDSYAGIVILGDNFDVIFNDCLYNAESENLCALREFSKLCSDSTFPLLFAASIERDANAFSVEEDSLVNGVFRKVQAVTLLGQNGEWENMVASSILYHPDAEIWREASEYKDFHSVVDGALHQEIYAGSNEKWLNDTVVSGAYPLHPAALYALPRVAMSLNSSRKTAFRFFTDEGPGGLAYFLNNYAIIQPNGRLHLYTLDWLCTYFEKVIQEDRYNKYYTSALQNAILAAGDVAQSRRILRLIMIMQMIGDDRLRPQLETILWALHLGEREERMVRHSLTMLLQKRAVEYSEATQEYLLPMPKHEVNIAHAVQRNRKRMRAQLNMRLELQSGLHTLRIKALGFNKEYFTDRCGVIRAFASGDIHDAAQFLESIDKHVGGIAPYRGDVLFAFVIPDSESEMKEIIESVLQGRYNHPRLVIVMSKDAHRFANDILEVRTLERMLNLEPPFSDSNSPEHAKIASMLDKVTAGLDTYAGTLLEPKNLTYYYNGESLSFNSNAQIEEWLDKLLPELVGTPPRIASSELMCLGNSGSNSRNRQRLLTSLLSSGESVALRSDDCALNNMFREGLVRTGIFREMDSNKFWSSYSLSEEIPDEGFGQTYRALVKGVLSTADSCAAASVSDLIEPWMSKPYSMTPALMELALAVIMWRWPRDIKVFKNNAQAKAENNADLLLPAEINAETVMKMAVNPQDWAIEFCEFDSCQKRYLEGICRTIGVSHEHEGSFWNYTAKALIDWYKSLDPVLREVSLIKKQEVKRFNLFLAAAPTQGKFLRDYLEKRLPSVLGEPPAFSWTADIDDILERFANLCGDLTGQIQEHYAALEDALSQVFPAETGEEVPWDAEAEHWLESLSDDAEIGVWQVEFAALQNALKAPRENILPELIAGLGYDAVNYWKNDYSGEIAERLSAMRSALEWDYCCRGYRCADVREAAAQVGLDILRASGLSREGAEEVLELYLRTVVWPESFEIEEAEMAESISAVVDNIVCNTGGDDSWGDWLYDDNRDISVIPAVAVDESDDLQIEGLEWPINGTDFLDDSRPVFSNELPQAVGEKQESGVSSAASWLDSLSADLDDDLDLSINSILEHFSSEHGDAETATAAEPEQDVVSDIVSRVGDLISLDKSASLTGDLETAAAESAEIEAQADVPSVQADVPSVQEDRAERLLPHEEDEIIASECSDEILSQELTPESAAIGDEAAERPVLSENEETAADISAEQNIPGETVLSAETYSDDEYRRHLDLELGAAGSSDALAETVRADDKLAAEEHLSTDSSCASAETSIPEDSLDDVKTHSAEDEIDDLTLMWL